MPCGAFLPGCSSLATVLLLPEVDGWPGSPFLALDARSASCLARLSAFISALVLAGLSEGAAADSGDGAVGAVVDAAGLEAGAEGGAGASTGEGMGEGTVTEAERKNIQDVYLASKAVFINQHPTCPRFHFQNKC